MIGDENNLAELADISVNILKLPTEDPTNTENMGMLLMINGFGECMQKYFQLEQVAFNVSRNANFANLVNRIDWFSNQTVNQVRIDELIAAERALTTSELSDLAVSLGFQNKDGLNDFKCDIGTDIGNIKGEYLSPDIVRSNEDQQIILISAGKYYPDQTKITGSKLSANLVYTLKIGNCSDFSPQRDIVDMKLTKEELIECAKEEGYSFVAGKYFVGISQVTALLEAFETGEWITRNTIIATLTALCPECSGFYMIVSFTACLLEGLGN